MHQKLIISDFLALLSTEERLVATLTYDGYTVEEVSEHTGYSIWNVYRLLNKTKAKWGEYELRGTVSSTICQEH
jgi:transposase